MLTGKKLFNTLLTELNEMGLPGMSATLDEMYCKLRSPTAAGAVASGHCAARRPGLK